MTSSSGRMPLVNLNPNVMGLSPSATVAINERSNQLRRQGKDIFKLGLGQSPFPVPDPVVNSLKEHASAKDYLEVAGLAELRTAVANYNRRTQALSTEADDVLVGPGSKELMFLLQLTYFGDLVIPGPSWVSYAPQAQIIGRRVFWLPTKRSDGWRITPETLEMLCQLDPNRPRLVILNYPSNPTGGTYTRDELQAMAETARKYQILLLSDEIYGELDHEGNHHSIAAFYPEGTIVSSGLSKWCGAGGWRLGTFSFPRSLSWLRDAMAAVASETYTSTSAPIQYAAISAFLPTPSLQTYVEQSRLILKTIGHAIYQKMDAAGVDVDSPQGAFYLFPSMDPFREKLAKRNIHSCTDLCEKLLQDTGVAILPGSSFGRPKSELTCRLAYVDFDGAEALRDFATLQRDPEKFLNKHASRMLEAIDRMCDWLTT